jgi:hypothetical protein
MSSEETKSEIRPAEAVCLTYRRRPTPEEGAGLNLLDVLFFLNAFLCFVFL